MQSNETLRTALQTLPWEQAESFNWRQHARRRARIVGGHVVGVPCPATGQWLVVPTKDIAAAFRKVFVAVRQLPHFVHVVTP